MLRSLAPPAWPPAIPVLSYSAISATAGLRMSAYKQASVRKKRRTLQPSSLMTTTANSISLSVRIRNGVQSPRHEAKLAGPASRAQWQLLFRNNGDGTFRNVTEGAGITGWYGGMSTQVGDFDNDGFDEITIGTGNLALDWAEPKPLFHNDGKGRFTDIAERAGLVHFGMLHGTALADYDDSGNVSLFGSFGGFYWGSRETSQLYRNLGSGNNSLEIRLVGTRSNRDAIGAKVSAFAGMRRIFKWVNAAMASAAIIRALFTSVWAVRSRWISFRSNGQAAFANCSRISPRTKESKSSKAKAACAPWSNSHCQHIHPFLCLSFKGLCPWLSL